MTHTLLYQHRSLVQITVLQTQSQRSVTLSISHIVVLPFLQQVQNRKEKTFLTCVMQRSPLVQIHHVNINFRLTQQSLENLHLIVRVVMRGLVLLNPYKTIKNRRTAIFVQTIHANPILEQFSTYFRRIVKILSHRHQMMQGIPSINILKIRMQDLITQDTLNLLQSKIVLLPNQLNQRHLVQRIHVVYSTPEVTQQTNKTQLTTQSSV